MKKFIGILGILMVLISCEKSTTMKQVTIEDFSKKFTDSLIPDPERKDYFRYQLEAKGNTNDSIKVSISLSNSDNSAETRDFFLTGDFNETIAGDYYGDTNIYITFDPYNATEGTVELKYHL